MAIDIKQLLNKKLMIFSLFFVSILSVFITSVPVNAWAPVNPDLKPYNWDVNTQMDSSAQTAFSTDMDNLNWITAYYNSSSTLVFFGDSNNFYLSNNGEGSTTIYGRMCRYYNTSFGSPGCNPLNQNYSLSTSQIYEYQLIDYEPPEGAIPPEKENVYPTLQFYLSGYHLEVTSIPWAGDTPISGIAYSILDSNSEELFTYVFTSGEAHTFIYDFDKIGQYYLMASYSIPSPVDPNTYVNIATVVPITVDNSGDVSWTQNQENDCSINGTQNQCSTSSITPTYETCDFGDIGCVIGNFQKWLGFEVKRWFVPSSYEIESIFKDFNTNSYGLAQIVALPLQVFTSLTTATCSPVLLPLPFVSQSITIPCMTPIYQQNFGTLWTIWQTVLTGVVAYGVAINTISLIKQMKDPQDDQIGVFHL